MTFDEYLDYFYGESNNENTDYLTSYLLDDDPLTTSPLDTYPLEIDSEFANWEKMPVISGT